MLYICVYNMYDAISTTLNVNRHHCNTNATGTRYVST